MTYGSWRHDQQAMDLLALDHAPECPHCRELNSPGATTCGDCGGHLYVRNTTGPARDSLDERSVPGQEGTIMAPVPGCTCGGRGSCTVCVLNELGDDLPQRMMATALDATVTALNAPAKPSNVVELHAHSKKVRP